jgi:AcrR family transcriptional regulator
VNAHTHIKKEHTLPGETRQKILEATERLIQMKGMARVTTREIAKETALSEGALYRHFEGKEEIFFAVLHQHLPTVLQAFKQHKAGTGTVEGNLEAILVALMDYFSKLIPMSAGMIADAELLERYRKLLGQMPGGPHRIFELMAEYLAAEQALGRVTNRVQALQLAIQLMGPCFQFAYLNQVTGTPLFGKSEPEFVHELLTSFALTLQPGQHPVEEPDNLDNTENYPPEVLL